MNGRDRGAASRGTIGLVLGSVVLGSVVLVGCSGEDLAERIAEEAIERESGGDVDIDLDDGDVRIQTDDGEFSIETDDEGNVSIQGGDGDFSIDSEDGVTVIESGDGETVVSASGSDLPDDFPDDVPLPDGFTPQFSQSVDDGADRGWVLGGEIDGDATTAADAYLAALETAGFEQAQVTRTPDGVIFSYANDSYALNGAALEDSDGATFMSLTVVLGGG